MTNEQKRQLDVAHREVLDAIDERDALEKTIKEAKAAHKIAAAKATKLFYAADALQAEFEGREQFGSKDDD